MIAGSRAAQAQDPAALPAETVRALFEKNCATCHGSNGDGKGTQVLDKPARSFKDGGFSYGNTKETITRTLTNGIPGTPMPSFGSALKPNELAALADYVIALGPPQAQVQRSETLLAVRDQPLFVRGKLPPIVDGAPETVRGLLVGTTDGLTFEYAVDDVRLLGVRQGEFVERKDWGGRGGDALVPLGKLVLRCAVGSSCAAFSWFPADPVAESCELRARFVGTRADGTRARVSYELAARDVTARVSPPRRGGLASAPRALAIDESVRACSSSLGSGFHRELGVDASSWTSGARGTLVWTVCAMSGPLATLVSDSRWIVVPASDGRVLLVALSRGSPGTLGVGELGVLARLDVAPRSRSSLGVDIYVLPAWNAESRRAWSEELAR